MILVLLAASFATVPARATHPLPHYVRYDEMVAMSDGVRLDASLYIPAGIDAPVPLLVRQHGGGSNKDSSYDVTYGLKAVETGRFALLTYSHRGHGNSEGLFDFFGERTTQDFSAMVDWATQRFDLVDDNIVGAWGYSQGGGESLLPAMADSRVKAVAVGNTFDDLNRALNPNDCFKFSFATGIFALAYKTTAARTDDTIATRWGATWYSDTEDVPIPFVDLATGGVKVRSTTQDAFDHSPAAHVVAQPGTTYDTGLNVPVFWSNSWEDALFPADHGLEILAGLQSRGIPTHLWFASGGHEVPETYLPDEAGKEQAMVEWFEEFLLGIDHGYASGVRPRVDYAQRIPGGGWTHKTAKQWPIPGEKTIPLAGGMIVNTLASANLSTDPILSNRAGPLVSNIPDGANPLDTLTSVTDPLAEPLEATGAPQVSLLYATTATNVAQFNVKVFDVDPSGKRSLVWRGCLSDQTPADGNATFALWPNSHVFPAGSRIGVTISTVDFPTFKPDVEPQATTILPGSTLRLTGVAG